MSEPTITLPLSELPAADDGYTDLLQQTARTIHEELRSRTVADQQYTLQWVVAQPHKRKIALRFRLDESSFVVSQWNKLDMYGVYFETDQQGCPILPELVWPPFTEHSLMDGLAYLLPTKRKGVTDSEDSDIEVALSLQEPLWGILESDPQFRNFRQSSFV